jgi:hypothetical protein
MNSQSLHLSSASIHSGRTVPLVSPVNGERVEGAALCVPTNESMALIASEKAKRKKSSLKKSGLAFSAQQEVPRREDMERVTREKKRDADPAATEPPPSEEPESAPEQPKE